MSLEFKSWRNGDFIYMLRVGQMLWAFCHWINIVYWGHIAFCYHKVLYTYFLQNTLMFFKIMWSCVSQPFRFDLSCFGEIAPPPGVLAPAPVVMPPSPPPTTSSNAPSSGPSPSPVSGRSFVQLQRLILILSWGIRSKLFSREGSVMDK